MRLRADVRQIIAISTFLALTLAPPHAANAARSATSLHTRSVSSPPRTATGLTVIGRNASSGHGGRLVRNAMFITHSKRGFAKGSKSYAHSSGSWMSCVPFARAASGIDLKGNAANWWDAAAGVYARGADPEPGSVLNFRANGHMVLGHVAVVTNVLDSRDIEIEHANWAGGSKGNISRGVHVVDVSERNDWSAVRVALGNGDYGSVYPTYGFIYDRPDDGTMMASNRPHVARAAFASARSTVEVAQAPMVLPHRKVSALDLSFTVDAPNRDLQ